MRFATRLRAGMVPLALFALLYSGEVAAQSPRRQAQDAANPAFEPRAAALLRRMVEAERLNRSIAREGTFRADAPGTEHIVKSDPKQGVRREPLTGNKGRVMVITRSAGRLGQAAKERFAETIKRLAKGVLSAQIVGQDTVAGRVCDIVAVQATKIPDAPTRRFWIDRETGLRLRTEEKSATGQLLSGSYYTTLDLSPTFAPDDFSPPTAPRKPFKGFGERDKQGRERRRFKSLDEAKRAGFAVPAPSYLPEGYGLRVVEATAIGDFVALRYTNGVNALSITTLKNGVPGRVRPLLRSDGSAFVPSRRGVNGLFVRGVGGAAYMLIGDLPEAELRKIAASIR